MSVISELIRSESDGTLSFGDYTLSQKTKKSDFMVGEDSYKIKTFAEVTRLEKNGGFVYESVPGTAVSHFDGSVKDVSFAVEGPEDAQITLELEPGVEYDILVDGKDAGTIKTSLGGKLSLSVELEEGAEIPVEVKQV